MTLRLALIAGIVLLLMAGAITMWMQGDAGNSPSIAGASNGRNLLGEQGCLACHAIAGQGGNLAPPLGAELADRGQPWLLEYLTSGTNINVYPGNGHQAFARLSHAQAVRMSELLAALSIPSHYQRRASPDS